MELIDKQGWTDSCSSMYLIDGSTADYVNELSILVSVTYWQLGERRTPASLRLRFQ